MVCEPLDVFEIFLRVCKVKTIFMVVKHYFAFFTLIISKQRFPETTCVILSLRQLTECVLGILLCFKKFKVLISNVIHINKNSLGVLKI